MKKSKEGSKRSQLCLRSNAKNTNDQSKNKKNEKASYTISRFFANNHKKNKDQSNPSTSQYTDEEVSPECKSAEPRDLLCRSAESPVKNTNLNDSDLGDFESPKLFFPRALASSQPLKKTTIKARKKTNKLQSRKNDGNNRIDKLFLAHQPYEDVDADHLQLAIALSKSVQETENPSFGECSNYPNTQEKVATIKKTLEQFGFSSNRKYGSNVEFKIPIEKSKRKKPKFRTIVNPILYQRTVEERNRLVQAAVEKVLDETLQSPIPLNIYYDCFETFLNGDCLESYYCHESPLFKKCGYSLEEMIDLSVFYVGTLVARSTAVAGTLLRDWGCILGREKTPPRDLSNDNVMEMDDGILYEKLVEPKTISDPITIVGSPGQKKSVGETIVIIDSDSENDTSPIADSKVNSEKAACNSKVYLDTSRKSIIDNMESEASSDRLSVSGKRKKLCEDSTNKRAKIHSSGSVNSDENDSAIKFDGDKKETYQFVFSCRSPDKSFDESSVAFPKVSENNMSNSNYDNRHKSDSNVKSYQTLKSVSLEPDSLQTSERNVSPNLFSDSENESDSSWKCVSRRRDSEKRDSKRSHKRKSSLNSSLEILKNKVTETTIEYENVPVLEHENNDFLCENDLEKQSQSPIAKRTFYDPLKKLNRSVGYQSSESVCNLDDEEPEKRSEGNIDNRFENCDVESRSQKEINYNSDDMGKRSSDDIQNSSSHEINENISQTPPIGEVISKYTRSSIVNFDEIDLTRSHENSIADKSDGDVCDLTQSSCGSLKNKPENDSDINKCTLNISTKKTINENRSRTDESSPHKSEDVIVIDDSEEKFTYNHDESNDSFDLPEFKITRFEEKRASVDRTLSEISFRCTGNELDSDNKKMSSIEKCKSYLKSIDDAKSYGDNFLIPVPLKADTCKMTVKKSKSFLDAVSKKDYEFELNKPHRYASFSNLMGKFGSRSSNDLNESPNQIKIDADENVSKTSRKKLSFENLNSSREIENESSENNINASQQEKYSQSQSDNDSVCIIDDEELDYSCSTPYRKTNNSKVLKLFEENLNGNLNESDETVDLKSPGNENSPDRQEPDNQNLDIYNYDCFYDDPYDYGHLNNETPEKQYPIEQQNPSTKKAQNLPGIENLSLLLNSPLLSNYSTPKSCPSTDGEHSRIKRHRSDIGTPKVDTLGTSFRKTASERFDDFPKSGTPKCVVTKISDVTPMADYDTMDTPTRNDELKKYGLKPLKRRRAVQMLRYIYNQTHPEMENVDDRVNKFKKSRPDNDVVHRRIEVENVSIEKKSTKRKNKSFDFVPALPSQIEIVGDVRSNHDTDDCLIFERTRSKKVPSCQLPFHIAWHNYVANHPDIKLQILQYRPIQVEPIYTEFKEMGFKFHLEDIISFLDRRCITIRTSQNGHRNNNRLPKKKKS